MKTPYDPPGRGINTDKLNDYGTDHNCFHHFYEHEFYHFAGFFPLAGGTQGGVVE